MNNKYTSSNDQEEENFFRNNNNMISILYQLIYLTIARAKHVSYRDHVNQRFFSSTVDFV